MARNAQCNEKRRVSPQKKAPPVTDSSGKSCCSDRIDAVASGGESPLEGYASGSAHVGSVVGAGAFHHGASVVSGNAGST